MTMRLPTLAVLSACAAAAVAQAQSVVPYRVVGDGIPAPLAASGNAERGRDLLLARDPANCILCHGAPAELVAAGARFSGNLAPPLEGAGARSSVAQLRLRIVDGRHFNPETIMPSYHVATGLVEVASAYRGKPILSGQQVEDLVAYLSSLR